MPYKVVHNHIFGTKADTIVCPANRLPVCTPGIEMDVYREAGAEEMLEARKEIGVIDPGQAVITDGFHSKANHIIHTVAPKWIDGDHGEFEILHECYKNSFKCTKELNCGGVAIPLLMSDIHSFLKKKALDIAMDEIDELLGIKENSNSNRAKDSLEKVLSVPKESFGDRLFRLIVEKGYSDTEETKEFIQLAGWGLSPCKKYDRIIRYFIENGNYDMTEINEALFKYTKKTLGV